MGEAVSVLIQTQELKRYTQHQMVRQVQDNLSTHSHSNKGGVGVM